MGTPDRFDDLPILGELRDALDARFTVAERRLPWFDRARAWTGSGLGSGLRAAPIVLAAVIAITVAIGALTVFKHGGSQTNRSLGRGPTHLAPKRLPSYPNPTESRYISKALAATVAADHACKQSANRGKTFLQGSPGPEVLSELGVMRRPALPADATTRTLFNNGFDAGAGVYENYIRRARTEYGKAFYLIPEARTTPFGPIPDRCYGETKARLIRELQHATPKVRRTTLAAGLAELQAMELQSEHRVGMCFAVVSAHHRGKIGGVDEGCDQDLAWLNHPVSSQGIGEGDRAGGTIYAAIVPDAIASATLEFKAGGGYPARSVTSQAVNNVVVFKIPPRTYHQAFPSRFVLRETGGKVVTEP